MKGKKLLQKQEFDAVSGFVWQFDADSGFQQFIGANFQLDTASEKDKERALERLKKLYDQVLYDYVEDLVASDQLN
jgi:hypothetical protein